MSRPRRRNGQRTDEEVDGPSAEVMRDVEVMMSAGLVARERRLGAGRRPIRRSVGQEGMARRVLIGRAVDASLVAIVIAVGVSMWWRYMQRVSLGSTAFGRALKSAGGVVAIKF